VSDGFNCNGGHFIISSYKLYINFGWNDGIVEIIWQAKFDFHATPQSTMAKRFTGVGTFVQLPKSFIHRVQSLIKSQRVREDVNLRIHGLK